MTERQARLDCAKSLREIADSIENGVGSECICIATQGENVDNCRLTGFRLDDTMFSLVLGDSVVELYQERTGGGSNSVEVGERDKPS